MRKILIAAICVCLASCQNAGYMMETYDKPGKVVFKSTAGTWWVFDRKDLGKLMTSPTPESMILPATVSGATFGLVTTDPTTFTHQKVAQEFLASTGRACEIKTTTELWRPNYEHTYVCK